MTLTNRELSTVLAALRHWQTLEGMADNSVHFTEHRALTDAEIDSLCERLNTSEGTLGTVQVPVQGTGTGLYAAYIGTANGSSITLHKSRREALEAIADFLWNDDPGYEDADGTPIQDDDELQDAIQDHCDTSADDYEVQEVDLP